MTVATRIINWNKDRAIPKEFNIELEYRLIKEELDELADAISSNERADALCDIVVLAMGSLWKLGINPDKAMDETLKEIESRTGEINPETGKWTKVITGREYTADYDVCKESTDGGLDRNS